MVAGWLTLTRFRPMFERYLQLTQTAYQKSTSVESNIMWITQMIGIVCNLGRSAIVPLIDASGAAMMDWI